MRNGLRNNGAPRRIRTPDLLIRSQALYPAELGAHTERNMCRSSKVGETYVIKFINASLRFKKNINLIDAKSYFTQKI